MANFDPTFAHDVALRLAEAAYLSTPPAAADLPANYSLVGPITVDAVRASTLRTAATAQQAALLGKILAAPSGFGWVFQDVAEKIAVISFRGTVSLEDWLRDFDFLPAIYQPVANFGTVHEGFQLVYLVLRSSLMNLLKQLDPGYTRLLITGHSLGAALCELAAPDLLHNADLTVEPDVLNFAGPRVGHHDFASLFDVQIDSCFRVVNLWDIVPQLPPPLALYEHVGQAVKVDGGFTLNELQAHSLPLSYGPGLEKLIPLAPTALMTASLAAARFPNQLMVGREP